MSGGGFPLAFTARSEKDSVAWRRGFLQTFLERDIPQLGIRIPALALRRFWAMLAHHHAQIWNAAELDLLLFKDAKRIAVECKRSDAPALTHSMRIAPADLHLDRLHVVYPGTRRYILAKNVEVVQLGELIGRA